MKPPRHIVYTLIYTEGGERKEKKWKMDGQPTGKKFKDWSDAIHIEAKRIILKDDVDFLASTWRGCGKK